MLISFLRKWIVLQASSSQGLYLVTSHEDLLSLLCSTNPVTNVIFLQCFYESSISSVFINQDCAIEVESE